MADFSYDTILTQLQRHGVPEVTIADVRFVSTIDGASSLEIDIVDPDLTVLTDRSLKMRKRKVEPGTPESARLESDGLGPEILPLIDLTYPGGSEFHWRLSDLSFSSDIQGANLTLTFEDRIAAYLRHHRGYESASRANTTRARFIKSITADEVKAGGGIIFVTKDIDKKQEIAPEP